MHHLVADHLPFQNSLGDRYLPDARGNVTQSYNLTILPHYEAAKQTDSFDLANLAWRTPRLQPSDQPSTFFFGSGANHTSSETYTFEAACRQHDTDSILRLATVDTEQEAKHSDC